MLLVSHTVPENWGMKVWSDTHTHSGCSIQKHGFYLFLDFYPSHFRRETAAKHKRWETSVNASPSTLLTMNTQLLTEAACTKRLAITFWMNHVRTVITALFHLLYMMLLWWQITSSKVKSAWCRQKHVWCTSCSKNLQSLESALLFALAKAAQWALQLLRPHPCCWIIDTQNTHTHTKKMSEKEGTS